jgi:Raf kinase inhibitor-like YbhB/YbcL family protein
MIKQKNCLTTILLVLALLFYGLQDNAFSANKGGGRMEITSSVFTEGGMIPAKYTCDGQNISPPLAWKDAPSGTKSFTLVCDDPDAPMGTWVHWVIYNIPPNIAKLDENVKPEKECSNGMRQGSNSWPKIGYGGPCPPSGAHRYYFKLYALDSVLDIKPGAARELVLQVIKGHVLAETQLMGKYQRQKQGSR